MADMSTAPKNGERILLLCYYQAFNLDNWEYQNKGTFITEGRYHRDEWKPWCGSDNTTSTETLIPIAWMHVPDELKTPTAPVDGYPDRPIGDNVDA